MYLVHCDTQVKYAYAWKDTSFEGFSRKTCENCGRIVAAPRFREERRILLAEGGGNYPDFLNFTGAGERLFLLSAQAVRMLEGETITGIAGKERVTVRSEKQRKSGRIMRWISGDVLSWILRKWGSGRKGSAVAAGSFSGTASAWSRSCWMAQPGMAVTCAVYKVCREFLPAQNGLGDL